MRSSSRPSVSKARPLPGQTELSAAGGSVGPRLGMLRLQFGSTPNQLVGERAHAMALEFAGGDALSPPAHRVRSACITLSWRKITPKSK